MQELTSDRTRNPVALFDYKVGQKIQCMRLDETPEKVIFFSLRGLWSFASCRQTKKTLLPSVAAGDVSNSRKINNCPVRYAPHEAPQNSTTENKHTGKMAQQKRTGIGPDWSNLNRFPCGKGHKKDKSHCHPTQAQVMARQAKSAGTLHFLVIQRRRRRR